MAPTPNMVDLITTKRDGGRLDAEQIRAFVAAYALDRVPDEQASALLMAIYFRGMVHDELVTWTKAMIDSGDRLDLSGVGRPTVDKHSTGGVGDKVSLVLVPLVAACGAGVPQLSGRGLGYTGGTLDKMEAIPGWQARLTTDEMVAQVADVGGCIAAAGAGLAPADRRLYALRDVTGTVESIPLIASSIMSKKIAEGTSALVLDVKVGTGAFMRERAEAEELARTMVDLGESEGVRTSALLTAMDTPLGRTVGNGVEVVEAVETLAGGGPDDLVEVTVALAAEMLELVGIGADPAEVLRSGRAMDVWRAMVAAQGGDPDAELEVAPEREVVVAPADGHLSRLDARGVGVAAWRLGAGRAQKEHGVSPRAGVRCLVDRGDRVRAGAPLLELHTDDASHIPAALDALEGAIEVTAEAPEPAPLVLGRIDARSERC